MAKITPDSGAQRSDFCRAALESLKKRAQGYAKQHPTLRHMLVLPKGETLFVPARPGCHPLGGGSYHAPPAVSFGDFQVATALPPESCWPPDLKPVQAVIAEQEPNRPLFHDPYRVHLFFGDVAGMAPLQALAADLVDLAGDVALAIFGARAPGMTTVFSPLGLPPEMCTVFFRSADYLHGKDAEILDAWLCTVHWWAWKAIDSPIHTRPFVVFGDSAIAADRRDQAVKEKLSFSTLDCDIFTATAATIDIFFRFFAVPPNLVWPADYPPMPEPQEPAPEVAHGVKTSPKANLPAETSVTPVAHNERPKADWRDVQERLLRLYECGERYTSQRELAAKLGCSEATVNKAIDKSGKLKAWMERQMQPSPKAHSLNEVVTDNTANRREDDPANALPVEDVDRIMDRLIEEAEPPERAKLHELNNEGRLKMAKLYLAQQSDKHIEDKAAKGNKILGRRP